MDFASVYQKYFQNVYLYIRSFTFDSLLAEEITQETFVKALQGLEKFDGRTDILAWLFTIARNTYLSHCRKQKHFEDSQYPEPCEDTLVERFLDQEQAYLIHEYLHSMQEPYKEVFTLRVLGELPFATIAKIFGRTESWARVTYYRAKKQIAQYMEELNDG